MDINGVSHTDYLRNPLVCGDAFPRHVGNGIGSLQMGEGYIVE